MSTRRESQPNDGVHAHVAAGKVGILFMQTQEFFGADSQIHSSIMRHLPRNRFDVHCAVPKPDARGVSDALRAISRLPDVRLRLTEFGAGISLRPHPRPLLRSVRLATKTMLSLVGLAWYVRRNRISVIHCTEKPRDVIYGSLVAMLGGARCVIHVHVKAETWIRWIVRVAMRRATGLIAISEFVAQSIRDLGYAPSRVFTVLNGLELDEWVEQALGAEAVRDEFGITRDSPVIVSASRLFRYKGQHELLAALPAVKKHFPRIRLLIVGEDDPRGYPGGNRYSEELSTLSTELGLDDNVVFTGFRRDMPAIMSACDVYAMPSFEEPFGMVFTEAMALERPVVALNNGGTKEVVVNEVTGLLSEPGDTTALAANLLRLLENPALRTQMGRAGRQRVVEYLNASRMAVGIAQVYDRILDTHPCEDID